MAGPPVSAVRPRCPGRFQTLLTANPAAFSNVGTPLNVPLHPRNSMKPARSSSSVFLLAYERGAGRYPGRYLLELHAALWDSSRFVIEFYRGAPSRDGLRRALGFAVRVGDSRPARGRHAAVAARAATQGAGATRRPRTAWSSGTGRQHRNIPGAAIQYDGVGASRATWTRSISAGPLAGRNCRTADQGGAGHRPVHRLKAEHAGQGRPDLPRRPPGSGRATASRRRCRSRSCTRIPTS